MQKYCSVTHITPKSALTVVVPSQWIVDKLAEDYESFTLEELNEKESLKFAFFYSNGKGVNLQSLEDVFFASNILYTLGNAGYLKEAEAIKAFHGSDIIDAK